MVSVPIVEFCRKIEILRAVCHLDAATLVSNLEARANIRASISRRWLDQASPTIHNNYRRLFSEYWKNVHSIPFDLACFDMPLDTFVMYLRDHNITIPKYAFESLAATSPQSGPPGVPENFLGHLIRGFVGSYQLIRPYSGDARQYVVEPMEITEDYDILMYSHSGASTTFIYEGEAHFGRRYCFSLLSRKHEEIPNEGAFRAIAFYIGASVTSPTAASCISGLMLRGMKGQGAPKRLVSLPFFALKSDKISHLRDATFSRSFGDDFHLINEGSHLLNGLADPEEFPRLHKFCSDIFKTAQLGGVVNPGNNPRHNEFFGGTDLVLHTVSPNVVSKLLVHRMDFPAWKNIVDEEVVPILRGA